MTDRLSDLLAERARQGSAVHPTMDGVDAAVARRATRRRRHRVVAGGIGAAVLLVSVGVGVAATRSSDDDPQSGIATDPGSDLPLIGIDLVGYVRDPRLDPQPTPTETDLTYAVFTGDTVDVLGPMMTVTVQSGDLDPGGTPIDLDGDGAVGGEEDGWLGTFPGGASVTWTAEGQIASASGLSGVPTDAVVAYAEQLAGLPIDLEEMPAPDGLERRQVVTFGPLPDFPSRTSSYQGPTSVVHVLTTREPGYFDLTRIVSTEGQQYEEIGFESSVLGPGEAIISPDDDGVTSALVRTDAGLTVQVFGTNVDADSLRTAIEQDHLVDLTVAEDPRVTTASTNPSTTTVPASTTIPDGSADTSITDIRVGAHVNFDRIVVEFADAVPERHEVVASNQPSAGECVPPDLSGSAFVNIHLGLTSAPDVEQAPGTADGPVQEVMVACEFEAFVDLVVPIDTDRRAGDPWNEMSVTILDDPARLVIDIPR